VIELRKSLAEAFSVPLLGAVSPRRYGKSSAVPSESQEHVQTGHGGLAGTWEVLTTPRKETAYVGEAERKAKRPLAGGPGTWGCLERRADATVVPPSEGNEARREGRQEVLAPS
jgi:hypothetical protein